MSNYKQETIKPYASSAEQKATQVEHMFDNIAHSYDRLNHLMSFGIDHIWRRRAIQILATRKPRQILDVATGTGDFAILAAHRIDSIDNIVGIDLSEGMMKVAKKKAHDKGLSNKIHFARENCEKLSFDDYKFDAVTTAYGMRNFEHLDICLSEMYRVLKKGGSFTALEFCMPTHFPMNVLFKWYAKYIIPILGNVISRQREAYIYLPETIKAFPQPEQLSQILMRVGFDNISYRCLTGGICILYNATKN